MKNKALKRCVLLLAAYLILGAAFYFLAGDSLHFTRSETQTVTPQQDAGELVQSQKLTQSFVCAYDELESLTLTARTFGRENISMQEITLLDSNGTALIDTHLIPSSELGEGQPLTLTFSPSLKGLKGETLTLQISSYDAAPGNAVSFYCGTTMNIDTGRVTIPVDLDNAEPAKLDGTPLSDAAGNSLYLCLASSGLDLHWIGDWYWLFYGALGLLLAGYLARVLVCIKKEKPAPIPSAIRSLTKYSFLVRQLVARDFKTKYKRSVLGMLWSFLNPLLTMSIQYVVFSTIFKSSIPNFVIYLLSGIICFNFFNEATGMCLVSIIGNASLINKVYVPKYIYPFSRTLSSGINLLLSLVPLLLMMLITRTPITPAILLLPIALLLLFLFAYGIGLILATMMVFFRDTQFLWGIFSMLLMYLTPIFYPENIIPSRFLPIYRLNPINRIITFIRTLLIDGVSPEPMLYLECILLCVIPCLIGIWIFRRQQDKFVLNI